jgi:hypothetical protein
MTAQLVERTKTGNKRSVTSYDDDDYYYYYYYYCHICVRLFLYFILTHAHFVIGLELLS